MIAIILFVIIPVLILIILGMWSIVNDDGINKYKCHCDPNAISWRYLTKTTNDISFNHFLTLKNADPDNWIMTENRVYYCYTQDGKPAYTQIIFSRPDFWRYRSYLKKQIKIAEEKKSREEKIQSLENAQEITNKIQQIVDNRVIKSREELEAYINNLYKQYKYWY